MLCGSQFRVVGNATFGFKKVLEQAMECDLTTVDIISLEEVVVTRYLELPEALTQKERRRNPKVIEFCAQGKLLYGRVRDNAKV